MIIVELEIGNETVWNWNRTYYRQFLMHTYGYMYMRNGNDNPGIGIEILVEWERVRVNVIHSSCNSLLCHAQ